MKRVCINVALCLLIACCRAMSALSPEEELKTFRFADTNILSELAASEPDVRAPVAIAWDADGRMFVAEMTDYPSGPVNGRIRMLEDRDGNGHYESSTVFATNLAFPNGVTPWKNGVLVTAAPDIWFLADTNGDGVADLREKILTGFAEGNQQLRVNGLFWGVDNWIYGANGRSDGEVKWADGTPAGSIRRHDFRFRPDTKQFEAIAGNSQFGMGHDDWGNRFPVFNNIPIRHVVIEDRYLARQPSFAGIDNVPNISPTADGNRVFALTSPNLLIPQPIGSFTSACGPSVYRGNALPPSCYGNYFVCEPVQNVVQRRVLEPAGSTFVANYAHTNAEFLASADPWFHGVFTATGPDGALYIVDFYRDLVEHPHWVAPELRDKVDWRKGEEHGRIWRVRAKNAKLAKVEKLSSASNAALVKSLEASNGWTRDTAQRLLSERHAVDAIASLEQVVRGSRVPQVQVCAMNLLRDFAPTNLALVADTLADPHPRVRETALRWLAPALAAPWWSNATAAAQEHLRSNLVARSKDPDSRVRLQAACYWAQVSSVAVAQNKFGAIGLHRELDPWQSAVIVSRLHQRGAEGASNAWLILRDWLATKMEIGTPQQQTLTEQLAAILAAGNEHTVDEFLKWVRGFYGLAPLPLFASFVEALPAEKRAEFAGIIPAGKMTLALHTNSAERIRVAGIRLAASRSDAAEYFKKLMPQLHRDSPPGVQSALVKACVESDDSEIARRLFEQMAECSKSTRRQIVASSTRQRRAAEALLDALERSAVPLVEVDPATREALRKSSIAEVRDRAARLFAAAAASDREAVVQQFRPALKLAGDRKRGAELFERICAVCHQMQGVGAKVGPDLSGIGQQPRETLLVQILDPSRQVLPDFVSYAAETKAGDTYTGFIANESATTVTLRRANEPDLTLNRSDLKELKTSGMSLMPDGLEAGMSEQDFADLIEFLRRPDRTLFTPIK